MKKLIFEKQPAPSNLVLTFMQLTIIIIYTLLTGWTDGSNTTPSSCNRSQLKGLYTYLASPTTFVYRMENEVLEKLGDIGVNIEYNIKWKDKTSCDHRLIVRKVTTTSHTPEAVKPYLLSVGDTLHITVLEVTEQYMSYSTRWQDKVVAEVMHRIPMEMLMEKE